jgi:hypothetical protein
VRAAEALTLKAITLGVEDCRLAGTSAQDHGRAHCRLLGSLADEGLVGAARQDGLHLAGWLQGQKELDRAELAGIKSASSSCVGQAGRGVA